MDVALACPQISPFVQQKTDEGFTKWTSRTKASRRGEKPQECTFLGMTFFWGKTRHGVFKVKRKTSRKQLRQSLAQFTDGVR
jgi:hypothetical protein